MRGRDGRLLSVPNSVFASKTTVNFSRAKTTWLKARARGHHMRTSCRRGDDRSIIAARSPAPLLARSPLERHRARARPHSVLSCPVLSCPSSFETTVKLQLEDLPKMIAVVDELRSRLAALRDTVVDGSRNFWVHLVDVTGESAQASAGAAVVVALRATVGCFARVLVCVV